MQDGYSFHSCEEDLVREFNLMEETYKKIYTKLGLDFRVVEADSGAIGGGETFHTRRGIDKITLRLTVVLIVLFFVLSAFNLFIR